ncbi:hypothetical protein N008_20875 [Hymenobacter sp. APR13]|nr:hypothetical protein N008_20875 [Hymenobacter sp. APR13]
MAAARQFRFIPCLKARGFLSTKIVTMKAARAHIWGELVGAVIWDEATGLATFEYDPTFKTRGGFGAA